MATSARPVILPRRRAAPNTARRALVFQCPAHSLRRRRRLQANTQRRRCEGLGQGRPRVGPAARSKVQKTLVARQPSRLDRRRPDVKGLRVAAPARAPI